MGRNNVEVRSKCSFCNKNEMEVRNLISGPENYICNECVNLYKKLFANKNETKPTISCTFCLSEKHELIVSQGARICRSCIDLCNEILDNKSPSNING